MFSSYFPKFFISTFQLRVVSDWTGNPLRARRPGPTLAKLSAGRWEAASGDNTSHVCHGSTSQHGSGVDTCSSERASVGQGGREGKAGWGEGLCPVSPLIQRIIHQSAVPARNLRRFPRPIYWGIDRMRMTRHESSTNEEQERLHLFPRWWTLAVVLHPSPPERTLAKLHSRQPLYCVICFMFNCLFAKTANNMAATQSLWACRRGEEDLLGSKLDIRMWKKEDWSGFERSWWLPDGYFTDYWSLGIFSTSQPSQRVYRGCSQKWKVSSDAKIVGSEMPRRCQGSEVRMGSMQGYSLWSPNLAVWIYNSGCPLLAANKTKQIWRPNST